MTAATITLDHVRAALALPDFDVAAAWRRMDPRTRERFDFPAPDSPRLAATLTLLYPQDNESGNLALVLIKRTPDPGVHSGQIAFPGGSREEADPDFVATALREACEELGVCDPVEVLGTLAPVYIGPSNFEVHPVVGYLPQRPAWHPHPDEVAEVIEFPLRALVDDRLKREELWELRGLALTVPFYFVDGRHKVWGATARILTEFEWRLRAVVHGETPAGD